MRRLLLLTVLLAAVMPVPVHADETVLTVNDGEFFYDTDGDCIGDTDDAAGAEALRHWHVGIPFAGADLEVAGGFGCLGGPQTWEVSSEGGLVVAGSIRYTWDTNVPGGCCNDVQLHVFRDDGTLVASTAFADPYQPVVPEALQVRERTFAFELGEGSYTIVEDVFAGEHTAWLSNFTVGG